MVVFPLSCSCGTHYNVELPESELLRHVPTRWLDWHWLDPPAGPRTRLRRLSWGPSPRLSRSPAVPAATRSTFRGGHSN